MNTPELLNHNLKASTLQVRAHVIVFDLGRAGSTRENLKILERIKIDQAIQFSNSLNRCWDAAAADLPLNPRQDGAAGFWYAVKHLERRFWFDLQATILIAEFAELVIYSITVRSLPEVERLDSELSHSGILDLAQVRGESLPPGPKVLQEPRHRNASNIGGQINARNLQTPPVYIEDALNLMKHFRQRRLPRVDQFQLVASVTMNAVSVKNGIVAVGPQVSDGQIVTRRGKRVIFAAADLGIDPLEVC